MSPRKDRPAKGNMITLTSGVSAFTGQGFIDVRWGGQHGQLTPQEAREHGLAVIGAAEAAELDALVFAELRSAVGVDDSSGVPDAPAGTERAVSAPKGRQPAAPSIYDDVRARLQAEREATREVTRELHEQVQAAKEAARDLRAARAEVWADAEAMLQELVDEAAATLKEWAAVQVNEMTKDSARTREKIEAIQREVREQFASLAGDYTPEAFRNLVENDIAATVRQELSDPGYAETIAQIMIANIDATSGGPGALARAGQMQRKVYRQAAGPVTVQTPDEDHPHVGLYVDGKFIG